MKSSIASTRPPRPSGRLPIALFAVAIAAALVAAACGTGNKTPRIIFVTLPPKSHAPTLPPGQKPTPVASVSLPTIANVLVTNAAPDGKWKVTFKKPVVGGADDAVVGTMNDAITRQVNAYVDAFTSQDLPAVPAKGTPSTLEGNYSVAYLSPGLLSLRFSVITRLSGAEESIGTPGSINLRIANGQPIALADLFTDPAAAASTLATKSHNALSSQLGDQLTWDGSGKNLDFFSRSWVFTPDGLEFSWQQGEIASTASGMPSAVVSWADLKPLLKSGTPAAEFVK